MEILCYRHYIFKNRSIAYLIAIICRIKFLNIISITCVYKSKWICYDFTGYVHILMRYISCTTVIGDEAIPFTKDGLRLVVEISMLRDSKLIFHMRTDSQSR